MELELQGKTAVVTGASGGLGGAIVRELVLEGVSVLMVGRNVDAMQTTQQALSGSARGEIAIHAADLTRTDAASECIAAALRRFGRIDILVNCAGATKRGDFLALTDADWSDGFALKFHGAVRMCRAAWPHLAERGGSIVNIAGVAARTPTPDFAIGGSVNSALLNFTKALSHLGTKAGVQVNVINPGYIATDRLSRRIQARMEETGASRDDVERELRSEHGIERFGLPAEIGKLVAFVVSRNGSYLHGASIDIDGGATRGL